MFLFIYKKIRFCLVDLIALYVVDVPFPVLSRILIYLTGYMCLHFVFATLIPYWKLTVEAAAAQRSIKQGQYD